MPLVGRKVEQEQASLPGGGPLAADPSPSWPGPCGEGGGEEEEEREEGEEGKEGRGSQGGPGGGCSPPPRCHQRC